MYHSRKPCDFSEVRLKSTYQHQSRWPLTVLRCITIPSCALECFAKLHLHCASDTMPWITQQKAKQGRFSEIIRHSFWHLDTWFPVDAAGWVSAIGVALLEEGCFWGLALRFQKPYARFSLWTSYLGFKTWALSWHESEELSPLESYFEVSTSYSKLPRSWCFTHSNRKLLIERNILSCEIPTRCWAFLSLFPTLNSLTLFPCMKVSP